MAMQFLAGLDWGWLVRLGQAVAAFVGAPDNWAFLSEHAGTLILSLASVIFLSGQRKLQAEALRTQLIAPVTAWGDRAIRTLAVCHRLVIAEDIGPDFDRQRDSLLASLSTEVDLGRLYFPNIPSKHMGKHKEFAFRGYRPPILDAMMFTYHVLDHLPPRNTAASHAHAEAAAIFDKARRIVISELRRYTSDQIPLSGKERKRRLRDPRDDGHVQVSKLAGHLERAFPGLLERHNYVSWVDGEARQGFLARIFGKRLHRATPHENPETSGAL